MTNRSEQAMPRSSRPNDGTDPPSLLVPVLTAGRMLGIGRTKVYELVGEGELELVHIGARALIPVESVQDFAVRLRAQPSGPVWVDGVGVVESRRSPRGDSQPSLPGLH
jgi:excisionase family DNA binding protein